MDKVLIDEIGEVGYTGIILHFPEDMGMRLESKRYTRLAGGDHSLCVFGASNGKDISAENNRRLSQIAAIINTYHYK